MLTACDAITGPYVTMRPVPRGDVASLFLNGCTGGMVSYVSVRRGAGRRSGSRRISASRDGAAVAPAPRGAIIPMSDATFDLESLLREKEDLIDALTERLEMTAEQLDRLQRTSGDRGHWLSGGMPAELVEQQQTLCEDLGRIVQQWEESQPGITLNRIEMQIQELRDLLVQGSGGSANGAYSAEGAARHPYASEQAADDQPSEASAWEALKAGLLSQSSGEIPVAAITSEPTHSLPVEDLGPNPFDGEPLNAPAAIDVDEASREDLQYAVLARDEFIAELLRRLRSVEGRTRPTDGWKALESVPAELRTRLESLERRLDQAARMSEVELSIERAKLGREAARLKQLEEQTQKAAERVGLALADAERAEKEDDETETTQQHADGRWLRMLGRNKR